MKMSRLFLQFRWFFVVFAITGFFGGSTFLFTEKPSLSKIVYSSRKSGLICIIDEDGKNEGQITNPPEGPTGRTNDRQPSCSPDGRRVAFRGDRPRRDIWVVDVDGKNLKNLTDSPEAEHYPAWSPDGEKIAFARGVLLLDTDIWVMDADGKNQRNLTNSPEVEGHPTWSPDGKRIAFERPSKGIFIMDADGENQEFLVVGMSPSWSPDGRKIAFDKGGGDGIWVVDIDGKNLKRLTFGSDADPSWSPDSSKIAFHRIILPSTFIYVMDAYGRNLRELVEGIEPCWLVPESASLDRIKTSEMTWGNIKRGL